MIDVYMNIACRASDYEKKSLEKLAEWQAQGKVIALSTSINSEGIPVPKEFEDQFGAKLIQRLEHHSPATAPDFPATARK